MDTKKHPLRIKILKQGPKGSRIKIENVRLAFVKLTKPGSDPNGQKHFFEVSPILPKEEKKPIAELINYAQGIIKTTTLFSTEAERKMAATLVSKVDADYCFLKDGDKRKNKDTNKPYPGFENSLYFAARMDAIEDEEGNFKPRFDMPLVRADKSPIRDHEIADELYSGVWADIIVTLWPYTYMKKSSVTVKLNEIMKLCNDEKLGGSDNFDDRSGDFPSDAADEDIPDEY